MDFGVMLGSTYYEELLPPQLPAVNWNSEWHTQTPQFSVVVCQGQYFVVQ